MPSTSLPGWRTCLPSGRIGRQLKMIYVYAIRSLKRNYIYVGMSNNIERRIKEHNNGMNRSTKAYKPFELIYKEEYYSRSEARIREKYLKSGIGKEFLKSLI
ncbi:MAG: GIY-YIG nuclease family protein [Chitinophagaceae bacterium]|nr:GIY-YIG nuclease family protein [Chitinophagaceae bacterium]